ncbi:MAG TPA: branched-chain amino acid ABC transporter permease, partial [Ilumatobacteraceae bacterium]|nr:branched-chain amino acid ABC transporter permease [Ilumatobacteraceae bacterium]
MPVIIKENSPQHWAARVGTCAVIFGVIYYIYLTAQPSTLGSMTDATIIAIAAVALNLLLGYNGQISIGHSAFAGLAAFATGYTVNTHGWSPYVALLVSIVLCFVFGFLVGLPALRLKGPYLALVTLAVAFVWPTIAAQFLTKKVKSTSLAGLELKPPKWTGMGTERTNNSGVTRTVYTRLEVASFHYWL